MKIHTEQLNAPLENDSRRAAVRPPEGFEALLARQMSVGEAAPAANAEAPSRVLAPPAPAGESALVSPAGGQEAQIARRMEDLFSGMEDYAGRLASDAPDALRGAYGRLEGLAGGIASLKGAFPDMEREQPELAALVKELEVLTVSETFKFNRGDYL
ncbi:MAG: hypothetical protein LBO77_06155 [Desulfovibrio sp.]|jgi:hypothetical protein|nr:hypothetical protein [Desulfovibrio sp.]